MVSLHIVDDWSIKVCTCRDVPYMEQGCAKKVTYTEMPVVGGEIRAVMLATG
jgi:hypothetical protein